MELSESAEGIFALLTREPWLKAGQIGRSLGLSKGEASHLLYGELNDFVSHDSEFRWSLRNKSGGSAAKTPERVARKKNVQKSDYGDTEMVNWVFRRIAPDEVETEITQRDQFSNDDVDLNDTVVREAIQNSLDAQKGREQVRVRFAFVDESAGLSAEFMSEIFAAQLQHASAAGLDIDRVLDSPAIALVIEDFGTTGLTGAIDAKDDDNFSDFWRRHGKSHKTGKSGGRWGLGKLVYSYSSNVGSFFGLTVRDGDPEPRLMGQAVLNTHQIDGVRFAPHGFYADVKVEGPDAGLQLPIGDASMREGFVSNFSLQRGNESGLSVIIPWPRPKPELDLDSMVAVGVINYFFPVLTDQLVLEFGEVRVDRASLRRVTLARTRELTDATALFDFVEAAHEMPESELLTLDTDWYMDWKLTAEDFDQETLEEMRRRFSEHQLIGLRLRVDIKRKDGTVEKTAYDLYLRADPDLHQGHDLYVRSGITVPGETKFRSRKALGALVARDEAICEFLGDAENAAHTKWNGRAEKLNAKYRYPSQTLSAIRNSLVQLYDVLGQAVEEVAEDALLDFFWAPRGDEPKPTKKGTRTQPAEVPPIKRTPRPIVVQKEPGGFRIAPTTAAKEASFPMRCRAEVAYDVPSGDPFKKYQTFDFELGKKTGLPVSGKGVRLESKTGNTLEAILEAPDFLIAVSGFDTERDLVVRVVTEDV